MFAVWGLYVPVVILLSWFSRVVVSACQYNSLVMLDFNEVIIQKGGEKKGMDK